MADRTVRVLFRGEDVNLSHTMSGVGKDVEALGKRTESVGSRVSGSISSFVGNLGALGAAAGLSGLVSIGKDALAEAEEAQKVSGITSQLVKQTGADVWTSAGQVGALATSISNKVGIDDEAIQSGENVLLTFKAVRNEVGAGNDVFNRATKAGVDLSAVMGGDLEGANKMLGKALQDPLVGITALTRAGVSFSQQQKDQIKALVESGHSLEAQKMILKEVEGQVGGTAAKGATATEKLGVMWKNVEEELGARLLPVLEKVGSFLADNLPGAMDVVSTAGKKIGAVFEWLGDHKELVIGAAVGITAALVPAFVAWAVSAGAAAVATIAALAPFIAIGAAIAALVAGIIWAYNNWGFFRTAIDAVGTALGAVWGAIKAVAGFLVDVVVGAVKGVIDIFSGLIGVLVDVGQWIGEKIGAAIRQGIENFHTMSRVVGEVASWIGDRISAIVGFVTSIPGRIAAVAATMWDSIKNVFGAVVSWISGKVDAVVGFVGSIASRIRGVIGGVADIITAPFRAAFNAIARFWNSTIGKLSFKLPDWIPGGLGGKGFDVPNIPTLHTGGVFNSGRGEGLALLQDGETVRTLAQERELQTILAAAASSPGAVSAGVGGVVNVTMPPMQRGAIVVNVSRDMSDREAEDVVSRGFRKWMITDRGRLTVRHLIGIWG